MSQINVFMGLAEQQSISLYNCKHTWEDIDARAEQLGLNRSKYTQRLYELEIEHSLLSDNRKLDVIRKKYDVRRIDVVILVLLLAMTLVLLWGLLWV